jgi:hypothetical protein
MRLFLTEGAEIVDFDMLIIYISVSEIITAPDLFLIHAAPFITQIGKLKTSRAQCYQ